MGKMKNSFPMIKANKQSLKMRKKLFGVATNDADYVVSPIIDGKRVFCPAYSAWKDMISRCYSEKYQARRPTYRNCSVCDEWLTFSNFRQWHVKNYIENYDLDKDIKVKGNKVYSPSTCLFVPRCINGLLADRGSDRGKWKKGVHWSKFAGKFAAQIAMNGKVVSLGRYSTEDEARMSYTKARNAYIDEKKIEHPLFAQYLDQHKEREIQEEISTKKNPAVMRKIAENALNDIAS